MNKQNKIFSAKKIITVLVTAIITLVIVAIAMAILLAKKSEEHKVSDPEQSISTPEQRPDIPPADRPEITPENSTTAGHITAQQALDAALKALGVDRSNVRDIDVDLEYKFGEVFYEVDFEMNQYDYEYHVDAATGKILKSFKELDR